MDTEHLLKGIFLGIPVTPEEIDLTDVKFFDLICSNSKPVASSQLVVGQSDHLRLAAYSVASQPFKNLYQLLESPVFEPADRDSSDSVFVSGKIKSAVHPGDLHYQNYDKIMDQALKGEVNDHKVVFTYYSAGKNVVHCKEILKYGKSKDLSWYEFDYQGDRKLKKFMKLAFLYISNLNSPLLNKKFKDRKDKLITALAQMKNCQYIQIKDDDEIDNERITRKIVLLLSSANKFEHLGLTAQTGEVYTQMAHLYYHFKKIRIAQYYAEQAKFLFDKIGFDEGLKDVEKYFQSK